MDPYSIAPEENQPPSLFSDVVRSVSSEPAICRTADSAHASSMRLDHVHAQLQRTTNFGGRREKQSFLRCVT
jgi:hypothetical protein